VLGALEEALEHSVADPDLHADPRHRARLHHLYAAAARVLREGAPPPPDPRTRGQVALALLYLREHGAEGVARYEGRLAEWLAHEEPAIRDLALRSLLVHGPPGALGDLASSLGTSDADLRRTVLLVIQESRDGKFASAVETELRLAHDEARIRAADSAAAAVGIDFVARARIHASRLDDPDEFRSRMELLIPALDSEGHGSTGVPDAAERSALREAWTAFLDAHQSALREGRRFAPDDPAAAGLIPTTYDVHPPRR
jgi:hypothetical protein